MVSASRALLGTPPCSPRDTQGVTSYSCHLSATSALPSLHPAWSFAALGGARGLPRPCCRGDGVPQLGTGLAEALGGGCGVLVSPRTGWGQPGDGDGSVLTQTGLDFAVAAVVPTGQICVPSDAAGGTECGTGVAATCPRPGGTLWVLVPMARPCRGQGLQGGQQPLLGVDLEAEEEDESSQN